MYVHADDSCNSSGRRYRLAASHQADCALSTERGAHSHVPTDLSDLGRGWLAVLYCLKLLTFVDDVAKFDGCSLLNFSIHIKKTNTHPGADNFSISQHGIWWGRNSS